MRELLRGPAPICLTGKVARRQLLKSDIWLELDKMQNGFCAYCERKLNKKKHIEHFRARRDAPKLEYEWDNLFGSCGDHSQPWNTCGIYKDTRGRPYDADSLIKPDQDDPSLYLRFSSTGNVSPKSTLTGRDRKKAEETIRVFNLNDDKKLVAARRTALKIQLSFYESLINDPSFDSAEEVKEYMRNTLASEMSEFSLALKQVTL